MLRFGRSVGVVPVLRCVLVLAACAATAAAHAPNDPPPTRPDIVGGEEAEPGAWPWHVAVYRSDVPGGEAYLTCGGALIDAEWVLTAAHCVVSLADRSPFRADMFQVGLGMHDVEQEDGQRVAVAQVVRHQRFGSGIGVGSDIALLRLASAISETDRVRAITPLDEAEDPATAPGMYAMVTGWGLTSSDSMALAPRLRQAQVPIADCPAMLPVENVICTSGRDGTDTCHGDSGGPMMVEKHGEWRLAGITSVGLMGGCGQPNSISLFTNVAAYHDWIAAVQADARPMMERGIDAPKAIQETAEFAYEIFVRNTGRTAATDAVVRSQIPDGVAFVAAGGGITPTNGLLAWHLSGLAAGEAFTATFSVRETSSVPARSPLEWLPSSLPASPPESPDIVGGEDAADGAWPWHGAMYTWEPRGWHQYTCGGSLIADQWFLTAAHCLYSQVTGELLAPADVEVRLGTTRLSDPHGLRVAAEKLIPNGGWEVGLGYDLGLVKLAVPVPLSDKVWPVLLTGIDEDDLLDGEGRGTVTGWGMTTMQDTELPDLLQQVELEIMDAASCLEHWPDGRMICAGPDEGGRSGCHGDSGGPFVAESDRGWVQVGVVHGGTGQSCGAPGNYSLFARVSLYHRWIAHKLATERRDKIIVNDALDIETGTPLIKVDLSPARTYVEARFAGPLPTAPPTPTRAPRTFLLHLPVVRSGSDAWMSPG